MTNREYSMGFPLRLFSWKSFFVIPRKGMIMEKRIMEIGKRIAKVREERGYKQEVFAELIQCSPVTISRWETGLRAMKISDLIKIAETLDVSADYLLGMKQKEDIASILVGLSDKENKIVRNTLKAMVDTMKS